MASINGIAHMQFTVSNMERSKAFYEPFLHALEMVTLVDEPEMFYCIGGRTGLAITPCSAENSHQSFNQLNVGIHHYCFRARTRNDVDEIYGIAVKLGANIIREPAENNEWAPGYYSTLFEDPDGIRIEINHIPGKGHLSGNSA
ncbi:MAG: bleomycin resistance protein [Gammaproteobacteria bacterium]|nr:MAG: bleomycin resistance protein [Gammaproteobacteria bacterium]